MLDKTELAGLDAEIEALKRGSTALAADVAAAETGAALHPVRLSFMVPPLSPVFFFPLFALFLSFFVVVEGRIEGTDGATQNR
jgi:hypothetical protein